MNGDVTILGNLKADLITNEYVLNTTTTNYTLIVAEDLSLNGKLLISEDASFNQKVHIEGDFDVNDDKFTIAAATGNTVTAGNLTVNGSAGITLKEGATITNDSDGTLVITEPTVDINASTEVNISNALKVGGDLRVDGVPKGGPGPLHLRSNFWVNPERRLDRH